MLRKPDGRHPRTPSFVDMDSPEKGGKTTYLRTWSGERPPAFQGVILQQQFLRLITDPKVQPYHSVLNTSPNTAQHSKLTACREKNPVEKTISTVGECPLYPWEAT